MPPRKQICRYEKGAPWQAGDTSVVRVTWVGFPVSLAGERVPGKSTRACDESNDLVKNNDDFIMGEPFSTVSVALDTRELRQPH
jgi:hypothetical protein